MVTATSGVALGGGLVSQPVRAAEYNVVHIADDGSDPRIGVPFVFESNQGIANQPNWYCEGEGSAIEIVEKDQGGARNVTVEIHHDFEIWRIRYTDSDSPSATVYMRDDSIAEDVDTNAQYQFSAIADQCDHPANLVTIEPAPNKSPTASFTVSPQRPLRGDPVTFDASGSSDPDGQITKFAWDFETDGTVDATGEQVTHTFAHGGDFTVTLRVTDDDGATDSVQKTITVWIPVTIDIKPDGEPDPINPQSQGAIPVAIRQTVNFDPTARVDVSTVRFGAPDVIESGGGATAVRSTTEGGDLILHFRAQDAGFDGDESQGMLMGATPNGVPLIGTDSVRIVG